MSFNQHFNQQLIAGQIGEGYIAKWLRHLGWNVLPVYEKEIHEGKGPRLFMAELSPYKDLIAPDLFAIKGKKFTWIEAKRKTRFSWYGKSGYWVTGIDKRHFNDYVLVQSETNITVWLMFLHIESKTWPEDIMKWNAPPTCPTGLFGNEISHLTGCVSHESNKYGSSGMIYWNIKDLKLLAELHQVIPKQTTSATPVFEY